MSTRKKRPTQPKPLEVEYLPPDRDEETIDSIVDQFGPGVSIKVYKMVQGSRRYCGYLTSWSDANIEEHVASLGFGPGEYSISILLNGQFQRSIALGLAEKQTAVATTHSDPTLKILIDQMSRLMERLATPREREPINDMADALLKLNELNPKQNAQQLTPETILQWVNLGKELSGAGDDSFMGLLKEIGPGILSGILAARGGVPPAAIPGPMPPQLAAAQPQPEESMKVFQEAQLKLGIAYLKKKAAAGSDPELYIDLIIDNQEDPQYVALIRAILEKEFSAFVSLDADLGREPFEQWFKKIYNGIRSAASQSNSVESVSGGTTGNHANVNGNGATGKTGRK